MDQLLLFELLLVGKDIFINIIVYYFCGHTFDPPLQSFVAFVFQLFSIYGIFSKRFRFMVPRLLHHILIISYFNHYMKAMEELIFDEILVLYELGYMSRSTGIYVLHLGGLALFAFNIKLLWLLLQQLAQLFGQCDNIISDDIPLNDLRNVSVQNDPHNSFHSIESIDDELTD